MKWSTLKRTTALRSKGTGLRRTPFKKKAAALLPDGGSEKAVAGKETAHRRKRRAKVDLAKRLDMVFSAFVRLRDAMYGGQTVCISCGRVLPFEQMECGHFFSRRSLSTRWDELNCSSQCHDCNVNKIGNLRLYEVSLRQKIGNERFDRLAELHNQERKWSDAELEDMIRHYTAEARRLMKEKGIKMNI